MRITSFLLLLYLIASGLLVAIVNNFGLPSSYLISGSNFPFIPIIITLVNLLLATYSILASKNINPPPLIKPAFTRWILIALGLFILFCSFTLFSVSLFSPSLFGSDQPVPRMGVISSIIMSAVIAAVLYLASNMNSAQRPNLFRYIALCIAFIAVGVNAIQCLMLIFAVPVDPPTAYPFLSGLLTVSFLPFSLLILLISKRYVNMG